MRKISIGRRTGLGELGGFMGVVFFLFLADAILSDWAPGYIQGVVGSPVTMGLIISFSSVIGLLMDLIFAKMLAGSRVKKLVWWSILGCLAYAGLWGLIIIKPMIWAMLLAMAVWGFYFDLFGFFTQQEVAENTNISTRASVWGVLSVVKNLAYFVGPIIGSSLLQMGHHNVIGIVVVILVFASLLLSLLKVGKEQTEFEHEKIGIKTEIKHWTILWKRVWPVLVMSLILGWVDATYWTTGTIVSDMLAEQNWWGGMFLSFYVLPSLLVGLFVSRWQIKNGKKKLALRYLIGSGMVLALMNVSSLVWWKLGVALVSSTLIAMSWPLINAVYTDLIVRMGREREHLIGLSDSMLNIAYIVGPIAAGLITLVAGETGTFVVVGVLVAILGMILAMVMPNKLRLPQKEMVEWADEDEQATTV